MSFEDWKDEVNDRCRIHFGMDTDSLPDYLWHDAYKDGYRPQEAFLNFLEDLDYE